MRKRVLLLFLALAPSAEAEQLSENVVYTCDPNQRFVQVEIVTSAAAPDLSPLNDQRTSWNPWMLTIPAADGRYIKDVQTVERVCNLSNGSHVVKISADPCNFDTQGQNGAMMMAKATISKDTVVLADARLGGCTTEGSVTTKVVVRAGEKNPLLVRKPAVEYFRE